MFAKILLTGKGSNHLFQYLQKFAGVWGDWNKFLIDRKGKIIDRYESNALPNDHTIISLCEENFPQVEEEKGKEEKEEEEEKFDHGENDHFFCNE